MNLSVFDSFLKTADFHSAFWLSYFILRQNGTGYTPFMEAAKQGHEGVFSSFLEHVSCISNVFPYFHQNIVLIVLIAILRTL